MSAHYFAVDPGPTDSAYALIDAERRPLAMLAIRRRTP